ncbi:L-lactate dehydrogenase [Rhodoluna lacicola]|uniref:L-lactate dehydrogenase n=1 Tax=Rhodoluna lacicola TaxID=529884 RepID=A0A060JDZ9_9MICO|nr:L-lactate dehydrogenase [Rhodoluna lacicola]AIC48086.1 L-lactate dehydrogenase [Rhodoluna lacicola]
MHSHSSKVSVIGAGAVGASMAYAMLIRESAREVVLYDINESKVTAEVLDLAHGTQFTGSSSISGGADISATANSDVVVITAGAKQNPGQTRLELAGVNFEILKSLLPDLLRYSPDAIFVLVTNPCDVLATAAQKLTGLPANRIFSSGTVLDSSRLRWLLAEKFDVSTANIHANIIGEHGDSEFALWSQATVGNTPLLEWKLADGGTLTREALDEIAYSVKTAAYKVIEGKGATNFAIGLSGARIVEAILNDEHAILPISSVLTDYHGISGIAMSVPTLVTRQGASRTIDIAMEPHEQALFEASASAIRSSLESLAL